MSLPNAIAAAVAAGHTEPDAIAAWLAEEVGVAPSSYDLTYERLGLLLGAVRLEQVLAGVEAAVGTVPGAGSLLTVLQAGSALPLLSPDADAVIAGLVSASVLTQAEGDAIAALATRPTTRAEGYGLTTPPTPHEIRQHSRRSI